MNAYEKASLEFHAATDTAIDAPLTLDLLALRKALIAEEVRELFAEIDSISAALERGEAVGGEALAAMLKELADVQYVLSGAAVTFGFPMDEVHGRVHASNMSKMGADGKAILREDGKVLKGPNYRPPELGDIAARVLKERS